MMLWTTGMEPFESWSYSAVGTNYVPAKRIDVVGRTCCMYCRKLIRDPQGVAQHQRACEAYRVAMWKPRIVRRDSTRRVGAYSFRVCLVKQTSKIVYDTLAAAWCGAQLLFAEKGAVTVPYFCWSAVDRRVQPTKNGPRYYPVYQDGCGRWHLSSEVRCLNA